MIGKTKEVRDANGKIIKKSVFYYSIRITNKDGTISQKFVQNKDWTTKKEVKAAIDAFLNISTDKPTKLTTNKLFELYRNENINKIKMRSIVTFDKLYSLHIKPILGDIVVDKINQDNIQKWQEYLVSKKFSNNYSGAIQQFLRTLINFGLKRDLIVKNPFKNNFIKSNGSIKQKKLQIWTPEEFHRFISHVDELEYRALFMILYLCGLRKGEAMALQIKDVNLANSTIYIDETWDYVNKITTSPKTEKSIRTIYIVKEVRDVIQQLINKYQEYSTYSKEALILGFNVHLSPTTLQRHHEKACIESGIKIITIHDYRHSHVSTLIDMGFTPHQIADRIGDTVEMINSTYAHLFLDTQKKMALALEEKFKGISKDDVKNKALN